METEKYKCPTLNKVVILEKTYTSIRQVENKTLTQFNCQNACVACGVVKPTGGYNWEVCPAAQ